MRNRALLSFICIFGLIIAGGASVLAVDRHEILWGEDGVVFAPLEDPLYVRPPEHLVVSDGAGGLFLVWLQDYDIYGQHIDSGGSFLWGAGGKLLLDYPEYYVEDFYVTADGSGGMIISWYLSDISENYELRAQRFDGNGVEQWISGGVLVFEYSYWSYGVDHWTSSDNAGGALFVIKTYGDFSSWRVFAQRIDSNGNVLWGASGVEIDSEGGYTDPLIDSGDFHIVPDDLGGAIVAYWNEFSEENQNRGIEISRVISSGQLQWTKYLGATDADALDLELISDGNNGAIVSWVSESGGTRRMLVQRLSSSGSGLWTSGGMEICSGTVGGGIHGLTTDGAGGAIIAWSDNRGMDLDIYGQLVDINGVEQWTAGGMPICTALNNQYGPRVLSDGASGALIIWQDKRSGVYDDIYAQRLNSAGVGQWAADGDIVCDEVFDQSIRTVLGDGSGEMVVLWDDYRLMEFEYSEIYMQRMSGAGAAQWTWNGELLYEYYRNYQNNFDLVNDGAEGAIAVWVETMGGLFTQRVDSLGIRQWTDVGMELGSTDWRQDNPQMIPTSDGGAIVTWQDRRNGFNDIYAQRIDASGVEQWAAAGVLICADAEDQRDPAIISDGQGGAILSWRDYRNGNADIYAQRVDGTGIVQWAPDGIEVCTHDSLQGAPEMVVDGTGGAIIIWEDNRGGRVDIYAQRIDSGGSSLWSNNGTGVCYMSYDQDNFEAIPDGTGGAIIAWQEAVDDEYDHNIYAQRIDANGNRMWGYLGAEICSASNNQFSPNLSSDGAGGAIIVWIDIRNQYYYRKYGDVFAQRVDGNGNTLWTDNGVYLTDHRSIYRCDIVEDGNGGAIIIWEGFRIWAQHINSDAVPLWSTNWPDGGVLVKDYTAYSPQLVSDGAGGAIFAWYNDTPFLDPGTDVCGQRIVDAEVLVEIGPVLYVDCDATGLENGSSWEDAFTDLSEALNTAAVYQLEVDEIWVADGTYKPTAGADRDATFLVPRAHLGVYGGFDGTESERDERDPSVNVTVLSGDIGTAGLNEDNSYHVVTTEYSDSTTVLSGFTIRDGYNDEGDGGAGLISLYPITLRNMIIRANTTTSSYGAVHIYASGKVIIADALFENNNGRGLSLHSSGQIDITIDNCQYLDNGGGLYIRGTEYLNQFASADIANVIFAGNHLDGDGGGLSMIQCSVSLVNALFLRNSAERGGAIYSNGAVAAITNASISFNHAERSGGGIYSYDGDMAIANSILWDNYALEGDMNAGEYDVFSYYSLDVMISNSLVTNCGGSGSGWNSNLGVDGGGNVDAEVVFVDAYSGDLRIYEGCPAIDGGDSTVVGLPAVDLAGNPRVQDMNVDMGAYEGMYAPPFECPSFGSIVYVDVNATGAANGSSWDNAFTSLSEALKILGICGYSGDVWVAEGTYTPADSFPYRGMTFALRSGVALYGGFEGDETSIDQRDIEENVTILSGDIGSSPEWDDNSIHVVTAIDADSTAVLDGFTVKRGYAYPSPVTHGAGILIIEGSPRLSNLIVEINAADYDGGGIYCSGFNGSMSDIFFYNNTAGSGGGLYIEDGSISLSRATFWHNNADNGAGMYAEHCSGIEICDATFTGNNGEYGGGLRTFYCGNVYISNAEFTDNGSSYGKGGGMYVHADTLRLSNAKFVENYNGSNGGGAYLNCSYYLMIDTEFRNNDAFYGGGMYCNSGDQDIYNVIFSGNTAGYQGAGIYNWYGGEQHFYNAVFSGNIAAEDGAGIYNYKCNNILTNSTFGRNTGFNCIYNAGDSEMQLVNSIIWDNEVPIKRSIENEQEVTAVISYSLVEDSWTETGAGRIVWNDEYGMDGGNNLNEDPLYANPSESDLRLLPGSPAIDAGDETVEGLPATDILGNPRILGETIDMGAYEGAVVPMEVTVATDPPGLEITVAGATYSSPYTFPSVSGTEIEIGTLSPQIIGDDIYTFVEWSDGGDTTHVVTLPDSNVTYIAIFTDVITGDEVEPVPLANALHQNHPNPFNPSTTISFSLRERSRATLAVYDVAGRLVRVLIDGAMGAGPHVVTWDGRDKSGRGVASGVYFYRLEAGEFTETKKMVLLR